MSVNPFMAPEATEAYEPETVPRPAWGFWMTLLWGAVIAAAWIGVQVVVVIAFLIVSGLITQGMEPEQLEHTLQHNGLLLSIGALVTNPVAIFIAALAAWLRRYPVRQYLGLVPFRGRDLLLGFGCLAVFIPLSDAAIWLSGRPIVPEFMVEAYHTARWVPLLIAALVAAAPLGEEIVFRGFLYRGLAESWMRPVGAIVFTSLVWAAIHLQYDLFYMSIIFLGGLLLGWLRWRTGSTTLTILLHAVMNLVATIEAVVKIEMMP